MNSFIISILFYLCLIVFILKKAKSSKAQNPNYNKKTSYNVVTDYNKKKSGASRYAKAVKRKAGADDEYDSVSMAYCESSITPSQGISFRNLREGADEMEILERRNAARERELERALHSEHSH